MIRETSSSSTKEEVGTTREVEATDIMTIGNKAETIIISSIMKKRGRINLNKKKEDRSSQALNKL